MPGTFRTYDDAADVAIEWDGFERTVASVRRLVTELETSIARVSRAKLAPESSLDNYAHEMLMLYERLGAASTQLRRLINATRQARAAKRALKNNQLV